MGVSVAAALALTVIYRLTVNLPDLPYSPALRTPGSESFISAADRVASDFNALLSTLPGKHNTTVHQFRFHQFLGTLAYLDVYADRVDGNVRRVVEAALEDGSVGGLTVSADGFEFHVARAGSSVCGPSEFQCQSGECIPAKQKCDGKPQCADHSDESKKHAECAEHVPVIFQRNKVIEVVEGELIRLAAKIDLLPEKHQVIWSRASSVLSQGALRVSDDARIRAFVNGDEYELHVEKATESDAGEYTVMVEGTGVEAKFEVRLSSTHTHPAASPDCPEGERACKSGHCIPVAQFCDRHVHCPDGDDEASCEEITCTSSELRCVRDNVCVPRTVQCDGWKDCLDGTDENNCTSTEPHHVHVPHKKHKAGNRPGSAHSQWTVSCEDGSTPEYSLHGSSYCWSNSVCPTGTDCLQGLCCPTGRNEKRSVIHGCQENEFQCDSGECIPKEKQCDRRYECRDGTDETKCEYFQSAMKAHSQQRQEENRVVEEEDDESAERGDVPSAETEDEHRHRHHHDNRPEQRHVEPEEEEEEKEEEEEREEGACNDQEFKCPYLSETRCFHYDKLCDGVDDCGDGSDEVNCDSGSKEHEKPTAATCTAEQFKCRDGRCIEKALECNRKYDCDDGSDETECAYFKEGQARRIQIAREEHEKKLKEHQEKLREREQELKEHKEQEQRREQEERRRMEHERRLEEQQSRRIEEERRLLEEERNRVSAEQVVFREEEYSNELIDSDCLEHEFQCRSGDCVDKRRLCDTRRDCADGSDEENCASRNHHQQHQSHQNQHQQHHTGNGQHLDENPDEIQITIYPTEAQVRDGREATFDCRARTADNSHYPEVRWTKVGAPLAHNARDSAGRLVINPVSLSDSGRYVCTATHNGKTVEAHATLTVQSFGPQALNGVQPTPTGPGPIGQGRCMADERQCGNNECVKLDYVCDGEPDCRDRSDEMNCPAMRTCEPNEQKCANGRCIQKMWMCDGDDDCGDNSDELNCGVAKPGETCGPTEFKCHTGDHCVPTSFHCDGTNDCPDGSDEVGCVQPTVVEPPETNKQVPQGSTFKLSCKAVAVPEPYINWRLNWGPVCEPPRCLQHSEGGVGTITINNAQPSDQGAYTCEAINVKGRVLATPDCIVRVVNDPFPAPQPQPTQPPRPAPTCSRQGAVSPYPDPRGQCQCKENTEGPNCDQCRPGSFHLTEKSPKGCLGCFCFGITNACSSSRLYRTKDRLVFNGDAEGVQISDLEERDTQADGFQFHKTGYLTLSGAPQGVKYWRLPQRFLGDKVTAYGGKMEFEVEYSGSGPLSHEPMVVLKGNQIILVHKVRNQDQILRSDSPVRITVDTYETNWEQLNGVPATREDLMMVLADLDAFMIRATHTHDQYSSSLGDVTWEIATERPSDQLALEVEQCMCPPGYVGTSCEDCAPGYERSGHGPYLGTCVPVQQPQRQPACTGRGVAASEPRPDGRCQCKQYAEGPNCDTCPAHSFFMAATNPQGCIPCFCSGVTNQCQSSGFSRTKVEVDYSRGDRDQLQLSTSDIHQPLVAPTQGFVNGREITFDAFHEANGQTLYWKMPHKFLGNKVTAYGGKLRITYRFSGDGRANMDPLVIFRGNDISLQYTHPQPAMADVDNVVEFQLFEDKLARVDGQHATREHLLMALADLDALLIKATHIDDCSSASLISVSLEYAEPIQNGGALANEVEQCQCPPGYVGTSCEDCAPGYSRTGGGLYLGLCEKCECNGHASQCDKEYGFCVDCQHNTEGDSCERCKPGFVGDARRGTPHDCQPAATRPPCQCNNHSPRGCDSFGRCLLCEHNTEGTQCERCKKGYYGVATEGTPYDCKPCPCPGASDCFLDAQGQVACRNCPAGLTGRTCSDCAPGYTRNTKGDGRQCEPIGHVNARDRTYVPPPPEGPGSGQPPQPVVDPPQQTVNEGDPASYRCWVPQVPDCQITWHKENIGGPLPHGVYQTGNALKVPSAQQHHAGNYICTATNQYGIGKSPDARLDVVRPVPRPRIDPVEQTVNEGDPARFRCWVPGRSDMVLEWSREGRQPLQNSAQQQQGVLHFNSARQHDAGRYECVAKDPRDPRAHLIPADTPATLHIRQPQQPPKAPQVDPPFQTVPEGSPAQFRCWVDGEPNAQLRWTKEGNQPLPRGASDVNGVLRLPSVQRGDVGRYICTSFDPKTRQRADAPPARLDISSGPAPPAPEMRRPLETPQVDPMDQTVDEGAPSRIRCWVPGNPHANLRWTKVGGQLPQASRVQQGVLDISSTKSHDAGQYVCSQIDPQGGPDSSAPPARINVRQPDNIKPVVDPIEQTVPEGSPFRIRCHVPGRPEIRLQWRKENGELPEDSEERGGVIQCPHAKMGDAGQYVCTAVNPSNGEPVDSEPATVHVTPVVAPPVVQGADPSPEVTPAQQTVPENDPATIKCWVPGRPDAVLTWKRRDGHPLPFGASEDGGTLTIPQVQQIDEGEYVCVWNRPEGPKESDPSKLDVEAPGVPPRPVATPPLLTVKTGEPARFHCDAHSPTPASIKWGYLDADTALPDGARQEGDDVVIDEASDAQIGDYVCSATNDFGTGVAEPVKLEVTDDQVPPTARVEPRVWNGKPGDRHQFKCIVTGVPTPKVVWTGPNGAPLPHDVTELEDNILDFANGRSELNGDYTCTATNPIGEASDHGSVNIGPSLTVKTTPAGPKLVLTVGEPLLVKCEAFGDPEPEVEWLYDPGPERGDLPDDYQPVHISEQFIRHPAIGLGNAGVYTCKGSNSHASATKNIYIEVVEASKIATVSILGGSAQWFEPGEPSELVCTATGSGLVDRLEWVKVDDQLPTDVEEHNEPGLLHFPNFKNSYAGDYECRGYRNNELIASSTVTVHGSNSDSDDVKVEISKPRVRVVQQGDSIVLQCNAQGVKNGEHYEWALLRGGSLIRRVGNEPELTIKKADPRSDFGVYQCNVEDDNGLTIGSAQTAVAVGQAGEKNAEVVKFDEKADASFTCPVYSVPGSKVEWSRAEGDLPANALPNGNKLEIKEFDDASTGMYVCRVNIDGQLIEGFVKAEIFVPDTIIQVMLDVSSESVSVGDRAWFECKVTGDPSAQISWTKEGADALPENSQVDNGRLIFTDVTEENAGIYRCRAKTKAGPLETRTVLNIGDHKFDSSETGDDAMPMIRAVGEDAYLSCSGPSPSGRATWTRDEGGLPDHAHVNRGVLKISPLRREDEGRYRCQVFVPVPTGDTTTVVGDGPLEGEEGGGGGSWTEEGETPPTPVSSSVSVAGEQPPVSENVVDLQVTDFIPEFSGAGALQMAPMNEDEFQHTHVNISFKPTDNNGLIFYSAKAPPGPSSPGHPETFHAAGLRDGKMVYVYNVGDGIREVVSEHPVRLNEWNSLRISNDPEKAVLKLNANPDQPVANHNFHVSTAPAQGIELGGSMEMPARAHTNLRKPFEGAISAVEINGATVDLGMATRQGEVRPHAVCRASTCLNGGACYPAHLHTGHFCACQEGFEGEACESRAHTCTNGESCGLGECITHPDSTWQCVCPIGRGGLNCETEKEIPTTLAFHRDTAYLGLPPPKNPDDFSFELTVTPDQIEKDSLLAHMGDGYGNRKYVSVYTQAGEVYYKYDNGQGPITVSSSVSLKKGEQAVVKVSKKGPFTEIKVNGVSVPSVSNQPAFPLHTPLFVGGLPPAVHPPRRVAGDAFKGCIDQVIIDGAVFDFSDPEKYKSGDVSQCGKDSAEEYVEDDEASHTPTDPGPEISSEWLDTTEEPEPKPTEDRPGEIVEENVTEMIEQEDERPVEQEEQEQEQPTDGAPEDPEPTKELSDSVEHDPSPSTSEEEFIYETAADDAPPTVQPWTTTTTTEQPVTDDAPEATEAAVLETIEEEKEQEQEEEQEQEQEPAPFEHVVDEVVVPVQPTEEIPFVHEFPKDPQVEPLPPTDPPTTPAEEYDSLEDDDDDVTTTVVNCETDGSCDVCANNTCGPNGMCRQYNLTHYECQCKIYYDGPNCDIFKPIEHAAKFDGSAYIEISADDFPHLTSEKEELVELKFKTSADNGILFWQGQQPGVSIEGEDYISIAIHNGHLHFSYELGGGAAHMVTEQRVNDGQEHRLRVVRKGRDGVLIVDNGVPLKGVSSGILAMLNVDGNIFIGGLPDIRGMTNGLHDSNFIGCIADVSFNGELLDLMGNALDGKNVRPCDEWLPPKRWLKNKRRTRAWRLD